MTHLRVPHPLVLLMGFIVLAALLSYVLPAGEFRSHLDAATQRQGWCRVHTTGGQPRPWGPCKCW